MQSTNTSITAQTTSEEIQAKAYVDKIKKLIVETKFEIWGAGKQIPLDDGTIKQVTSTIYDVWEKITLAEACNLSYIQAEEEIRRFFYTGLQKDSGWTKDSSKVFYRKCSEITPRSLETEEQPAEYHQPVYLRNILVFSDISANILVYLKIEQIWILWLCCKIELSYFNNENNNNRIKAFNKIITDNEITFWKSHQNVHRPEDKGLPSEYKKIIYRKHFANQIIKSALHDYKYFKPTSYGNDEYSTNNEKATFFGLAEITICLMNDAANEFLENIRIVHGGIMTELYGSSDRKKQKDNYNLLNSMTGFVGLYPCIIRMNASSCFDLVTKVYCITANFCNSSNFEYYTMYPDLVSKCLKTCLKLIGMEKNEFFIKRFLELTLSELSISNKSLYEIIQFALNDGTYHAAMNEAFSSLPTEKADAILENIENSYSSIIAMDHFEQVCFSPIRKCQEELIKAAKSLKLLKEENATPDTIEELLKLKSIMNDLFDQYISHVQNSMKNSKQGENTLAFSTPRF